MKQSLAARFLFRVVVLAFLVYAMLLTWWTPFTGDSLMHSVFGADHRPCLSARAGAVLVVIHALESPAGGIPRYFYGYGGKMAFSGRQSLRASFPGVDDVFPGAGKKGQFRKLADVLLFAAGALLLLTSSSRPGITMFWLSGGTITHGRPPSGWVSCACTAPYGQELPGFGTLLFPGSG